MTLAEVAAAMSERTDLPADLRGPLTGECDETVNDASFPYGCHVCEVEIDPETGRLADRAAHRRRRCRPRGQSADHPRPDARRHGAGHRPGAAGAVLLRRARPASCCPARSWTTRCRAPTCCRSTPPRSARCPRPRIRSALRPAGEGGTTPALGVVVNAMVDALAEFGVDHIEMPATPERIWRAHARQAAALAACERRTRARALRTAVAFGRAFRW